MTRIWLAALLVAPLAAGMLIFEQEAAVASASQAPFAPLSGGDAGLATIGASQTSAAVSVSATSIATANDVLDITSTDGSWQVHAEYLGHSGFTGLLLAPVFTVSLQDGTTSVDQVRIEDGVATVTTGAPVDLPTTQDTELFAQASLLSISGTVQLQLVLTPDHGAGPVLRYDVEIAVTA